MHADLMRRLAAEALGTALLVLFGAGSVVAALTLGGGKLDYAGLGMIALAFGLVIAVVIYALGTTSGAHINPAVTVSLAAVGRFSWRDVGPYVAAQLAGAVVGALLILAAFGGAAADLGTGQTTLSDGVSFGQGLVAEAVGTYLLLFAIMGLAVDQRAPTGWAGLMIGLAVTCAIMVMGPLTGGSLNPARTFGPVLATAIGGGDAGWSDLPVYILGPLIGGLAAVFSYDAVARPRDAEVEAAEPPQGTQGDVTGRGDADLPAATEQGTAGAVEGRRVLPEQ